MDVRQRLINVHSIQDYDVLHGTKWTKHTRANSLCRGGAQNEKQHKAVNKDATDDTGV